MYHRTSSVGGNNHTSSLRLAERRSNLTQAHIPEANPSLGTDLRALVTPRTYVYSVQIALETPRIMGDCCFFWKCEKEAAYVRPHVKRRSHVVLVPLYIHEATIGCHYDTLRPPQMHTPVLRSSNPIVRSTPR